MSEVDDSHTIGLHSGVSNQRLDEMKKQMIEWLVENMMARKEGYCACEAINQIVKIGKTKAEVATLAMTFGKNGDAYMYLAKQEWIERTAN